MIPCRTQVWKPTPRTEHYWNTVAKDFLDRYTAKLGLTTPLSDVEKLMCVANALPFGHPMLHEFMILCWQHWWGDKLQIESQGIINHWLVRIVKGLCSEKILDIMGAASSGKTYIVAAYGYTMWKLRPHETSVFLSTTSAEAGESRTWGAVKELHSLDTSRVGKRIDSLRLITLHEEVRDEDGVVQRDLKDVIKCVNIKPGQEGKNVIGSICGRKNNRVIWGADEMGYMDVGVLSARVALAPNPFNQFIGMNNAPEDGDPMYIDAEPHGPDFPDGWRSVDKDIHEEWPTKTGKCIYLNSDKCPNTLAADPKKPPFPKLMTAEMRELTIRSAGGIDTPMAWKYIYGFPASVDIPDKVLTHKLLETNGVFLGAEWVDASQKTLAGLDLGFREGGDPCVIHFGKVGVDVRGKKILGMEPDGSALNPSTKEKDAYEIQIARRVVDECRRRGCHDLALDVTGDGGILLQHIEREARSQGYALNVLAVSFSGTASDNIVIPGEKRVGTEMFHNKVAELWVSLRLSCINGVLRGMSEHGNAKQQLCSRKGSNDDKKRYSVEPKKEMKKRIKRSPDHGDACVLLHHLALRHGLSGETIPQRKDPQKRLEELAGAAGGARKRYGEFGRAKYGG